MNRRLFLAGIFGAATVAAMPSAITLLEPITPDWQAAMRVVMNKFMEEFVLYGTAAVRYTETFPYVEVVTAQEIYLIPELNRSLGEI